VVSQDDERITTTCPACGARQVVRTNRQTQQPFVGCETYPVCSETGPVPEWLRLKRAGAIELPGLEG